jgi:hypothetical protein
VDFRVLSLRKQGGVVFVTPQDKIVFLTDTFAHKPFVMDLTLTDSATRATGTLTFAGEFNGDLTYAAVHVSLTLNRPANDP